MIGKIHQMLFGLLAVITLNACHPKPLPTSIVESDALGRRVLPLTQPYYPQWEGEAVSPSLQGSMETTRQLAWRVFAEVVTPVSFVTRTNDDRILQAAVPRFLTWFTIEDAQRWFRYALQQSPTDQVVQGGSLTAAQVDAADLFLTHELDTMPEPLRNRLRLWFDEHPEPTLEEWSGIGGTSRVYYSPDLMHAVLQNYAELGGCFQGLQRPAAFGTDPTCLRTEWPRASAIVKAAWWNSQSQFKSFPTDAATLQQLMKNPESSWMQIAQNQDTPKTILSVRVGEQQLVLPGLHIMTKDQKDWLWITAWWSADPDSDFGADRPEFVRNISPLLGHYKICAVTRFQDDAEDWDALAQKYPDLVAAFRAAQSGNPGSSWCSNPYVEMGVSNQRTNCIGCHQFAGTDARQDAILHDAVQFPQYGTRQQRSNFITDYVWSAALGGQSLHQLIHRNLTWRKTLPVE
ncbi:MAG TPA: hypothetical protein VE954_06840 [Oligoflexus sp.]|uniref:hypothetical protein n=1 Tax=Oligoflexus sp. TaxID=1971216 RepID=UPI002D4E4AAC|nr:hypothetical protein [Oligoflexus sp.]HYX32813.1 hypothetical protein [Oligoflexus sp.]